MREMQTFQVVLDIAAQGEIEPEALEHVAESVLDRVQREAAFQALGPAVSVEFDRGAILMECTVAATSPEDLNATVARITDVMLEAANAAGEGVGGARGSEPDDESFEFDGSSTKREPVPA